MAHADQPPCKLCGAEFHALGLCRRHYYQDYKARPVYRAYRQSPRAKALNRAQARRREQRLGGRPRYELRKAVYSAVHREINQGAIRPKPCEVCGAEKAQAHHDSYLPKYWLTVRWLCPKHHAQWHLANCPMYPPGTPHVLC